MSVGRAVRERRGLAQGEWRIKDEPVLLRIFLSRSSSPTMKVAPTYDKRLRAESSGQAGIVREEGRVHLNWRMEFLDLRRAPQSAYPTVVAQVNLGWRGR